MINVLNTTRQRHTERSEVHVMNTAHPHAEHEGPLSLNRPKALTKVESIREDEYLALLTVQIKNRSFLQVSATF